MAPTTTLRKHVVDMKTSMIARFETSVKTGKLRRFKGFLAGVGSWSRVERIIARVEVGAQGADIRFIVTSLAGGKARALYVPTRRSRKPHQVVEDASRRGASVRGAMSETLTKKFGLRITSGPVEGRGRFYRPDCGLNPRGMATLRLFSRTACRLYTISTS